MKVGHRQAFIPQNPTGEPVGFCLLVRRYAQLAVALEKSSKDGSVARSGASQAEAGCIICKSCVIVSGLAVTERLGKTLIFR